jgi:hypothetical protein
MAKSQWIRNAKDWLRADDALARNPELRFVVEQAYRKGYVQGFYCAVDASQDGIDPFALGKVANLLWDWKEDIESEPVPTIGQAWTPPPTEVDRGIEGLIEELGDRR